MKSGNKVYPGVLVSATQGRSGKTLISLALCASLRKRALSVQPFKKGPDYIDPSWLSVAAGRECRNLDLFLMSEETTVDSFRNASRGADLAVIEGAMGLYDGLDTEGWGSPAHLARLLKIPVLLIVDATRMTSSVAAMVTGYQNFQPDINIAGVILNNVANKRHRAKLIAAVEQHCGIPVVGEIPRDPDLHMTQRHLGHIPIAEVGESDSIIQRICSKVERHLDLDRIIEIASDGNFQTTFTDTSIDMQRDEAEVKIGILRDRVFNFYYPENLEALCRAGAELVYINSLQDRLPEIDGLYIGGGFPEFNLKELEANHVLRWDIAKAIEEGLPVYAECAGLMYLCKDIGWQGQRYEMVGVIPAEVDISPRPQGHGYVVAEVVGENPFFPTDIVLRGHEFHHSKIRKTGNLDFAYKISRGHGIDGKSDGVVYKNVLASYTHLHALGAPQWAQAFVARVRRERRNQPLVAEVAN
ncbi:cobyrinate a,c-diamide synthase [Chloroflexota bacterium]